VDADPGKPLPISEKLLDYELGYTFSTNLLKVNVNVYYMDYFDQLVLTGEINDVGAPVMNNVARSYRQGVEISATIKPLNRLEWSGNVTLSQNKIKNYSDHVDNWDYWNDPDNQQLQYVNHLGETDISFSPSVIASSQFQYKPMEFLRISFNSKYVGKQYIDNTSSNNRVLDAYFLNDIRFNTTLKKSKLFNIEAIVTINNLFNHEYETNAWLYQYIEGNELKIMDGFFPQAGRNYMISFILNF
jgi:iron complex outermembrane receptor protein